MFAVAAVAVIVLVLDLVCASDFYDHRVPLISQVPRTGDLQGVLVKGEGAQDFYCSKLFASGILPSLDALLQREGELSTAGADAQGEHVP